MKICLTSTGPSLQDKVDARFGRAAFFVIYDSENNQHEVIENPYLEGGGAGLKASQLIIDQGVNTVLSGELGPNAKVALDQAGIDFKKADLAKTIAENIQNLI